MPSHRTRIATIAVMLTLLSRTGPAEQASSPMLAQATSADRVARIRSAAAEVDQLIRAFAERSHVPGIAYGILVDGQLVHTGVSGVRELAGKSPVDADTVFRIASMTKSFTALCILKLRDEGKLSLDDPAERYVPELAGLKYPTRDSPKLTIRHLLSHCEGFPEDNPWGDQQLAVTEAEFTQMLAAASRSRTRPASPTSTRTTASRFSAALCRASRACRTPRTCRRTSSQPLGMTSTTLEPASVPAARLAHGYRWEDDAVEGGTAAARRRVRRDGRHADVDARPRRATSASS